MSHTDSSDKTGMSQTPEPVNHINIELDQDTLATVVGVFDKIIEDPDDIDASRMDLPPFEQFVALAEKLRGHLKDGESIASIPFTYTEWNAYEAYVAHSFDIDLDEDEESTMNRVYTKNSNIQREGLDPTGP